MLNQKILHNRIKFKNIGLTRRYSKCLQESMVQNIAYPHKSIKIIQKVDDYVSRQCCPFWVIKSLSIHFGVADLTDEYTILRSPLRTATLGSSMEASPLGEGQIS